MVWFIHTMAPEYNAILQASYKNALLYAKAVSDTQGLKMIVERLAPIHLGLTAYALEYNAGDKKEYTLLTNCGVFMAGAYNASANLISTKMYRGKDYLGEWVLRDIYKFQEQQGVYAGNLEQYQWRSNEVIGIDTNQSGVADEDCWLIGFTVMPESLRDAKIVV